MHVFHTDTSSFLIKNNQNTHHSNSLPMKIILIPTSAFIFSMSEYFFLIHFINFFLFHTIVFFIQPNNIKVILFFHFHSFKDAHELESRYDSSNASVLETKNGGRSKKKKKKPARCIKCKQANRKIWTIGQSTSVCVLLGLAIFVTGILNLD